MLFVILCAVASLILGCDELVIESNTRQGQSSDAGEILPNDGVHGNTGTHGGAVKFLGGGAEMSEGTFADISVTTIWTDPGYELIGSVERTCASERESQGGRVRKGTEFERREVDDVTCTHDDVTCVCTCVVCLEEENSD